MNETLSEQLPEITTKIEEMVRATFPEVRFTNVWVRPGTSSWFGDAIMDIWAIYDGEVGDLQKVPDRLSLGTRVQDMLWGSRPRHPAQDTLRHEGRRGRLAP